MNLHTLPLFLAKAGRKPFTFAEPTFAELFQGVPVWQQIVLAAALLPFLLWPVTVPLLRRGFGSDQRRIPAIAATVVWVALFGGVIYLASSGAGLGRLLGGLWGWLPLGGRLVFIAWGVLFIGALVFWGLRRLSTSARRAMLWAMAVLGFIGTLGFGVWVSVLPEQSGSYFVLWHQFVRGATVVSAVMFVVGTMLLALPWGLDRVEGSGFIGYVAARHVRAGKSGFLTVISVLSILGVFLSSFALCAVISIMGGFGADLKRKILGNNAHIRVDTTDVNGFTDWQTPLDKVRTTSGVLAATPIAAGEAMASSNSNTAGVMVRGVDPKTIGNVIDLVDNVEVGRFSYLEQPEKLLELPDDEPIGIGPGGTKYFKTPRLKGGKLKGLKGPKGDLDPEVKKVIRPDDVRPGIVIGRELARTLNLFVGDEITLVSPIGDLTPVGPIPRSQRFRVAAIFYSGMYEYDASHAYVTLETAQDFLDLGQNITGYEVKVDREDEVTTVKPAVVASLGRDDLRVRDWEEMNKNLFSALKLEKIVVFIVLCLAVIVASFCIVCTLLLLVTEKSKEIAILKALGASDRSILTIFMSEGIIIGGIGTIFGVTTGLITCLGLMWSGTRLDPQVYYVDRLPISVDPVDYSLIAVSALVITTLATIYPALAASGLRPVDGIRYE